jgi:hypothetical protein
MSFPIDKDCPPIESWGPIDGGAAPEISPPHHARKGVMQMATIKVEPIAPIPSIMKSA